MAILDHKAQAYDLLLNQYKNSPKLIGLINSYLDISQNFEDSAQTLFDKFDINTTNADFLDAIGQLLGLERFPIEADNTQFFQFDVTPLDSGFRFFDGSGTPYVLVDNPLYRRALKAWTITMNSVGTTNDLIQSLAYLFDIPVELIEITETLTTVTIFIPVVLQLQDLGLFNYVTKCRSRLFPKVAGYDYILNYL